ncbi:unnamed protein product [Camellia sinensis]
MEYGIGGGASGGSGGDHHDDSDPHRRKKRYHRHTAYQIQKLEAIFKDSPHPDEKQRLQLSRELGLAPRQIKFWFQNRRTQMKAQHERADNGALRAENDRIRCENIAIREALKNVICPTCGGPPVSEDSYFDEQKLQMENAQLKEELDRVSSIAAKYLGRPVSQLPPVQPIQISSLDLSMATFGAQAMMGGHHSLDLDLDLLHLPVSSSSTTPQNLPFQAINISEMDKSLMADVAGNAMEEFIRLLQNNDGLWIKSSSDGKDVLNLDTYERLFPRANNKNPNVRIEASRDSGVVIMNGLALVEMFMDSNKWVELFPTIISKARTLEVISSGVLGGQSGSLQLMYEEVQVLSPLVATRQFYVLRLCQQIEQGSWAIVNVSYDHLPQIQETSLSSSSHSLQDRCHKLPSGCFIQDMPNGYSKVTWVEHVEIQDKTPTHRLFKDLIHSGLAFGAERWLASLQRMCERFACLMVTGNSTRDLGGVIPSSDGKRSMMKLAQRMINNFCGSINPSNGHQWTSLSGLNEVEVRASLHKSTDPGQPSGVVLSAATTIWVPVSPQNVFNFFRDERTRPQWDVLFNGNAVQEVAHIANGSHPGNCISVLRAFNTSQNNMLILQESCIDSSGSLVVYCPVDLPAINIAMSGEDPSYIPLLPSGFTIMPDGQCDMAVRSRDGGGASTSDSKQSRSTSSAGSLITVVFQILVSSLPTAKMNPESVTTVNNLIGTTVHQIKAALNCTTSRKLSSSKKSVNMAATATVTIHSRSLTLLHHRRHHHHHQHQCNTLSFSSISFPTTKPISHSLLIFRSPGKRPVPPSYAAVSAQPQGFYNGWGHRVEVTMSREYVGILIGIPIGTFDPELRSVLELATDSELYELERILFGPSYFSPLLKSITKQTDVDYFMIEEDAEERDDFIAMLESRFLFLAADARSTLRGWRPSYRNVLLGVREKLNIPCSSKLSTEDLEAEIFLHLLQEYSRDESGTFPSSWESSKNPDNHGSLELGLSPWKVQAIAALRVGASELRRIILKGGGMLTLGKAYNLLARKLLGRMFLEGAKYQIKKEVIRKGGQLAAVNLESRLALLVAKQVLWGTFLADVVIQMLGTDYARILRAIYAFAQLSVSPVHIGYRLTSTKEISLLSIVVKTLELHFGSSAAMGI